MKSTISKILIVCFVFLTAACGEKSEISEIHAQQKKQMEKMHEEQKKQLEKMQEEQKNAPVIQFKARQLPPDSEFKNPPKF